MCAQRRILYKYISISVFVIQALFVSAQPATLPATYPSGMKPGFVRAWDATAPETNAATLPTKGLREVKQTTVYYDGAGRTFQTVVKKGSLISNGSPLDAISSAVYDDAGREQYKYLSFASTASDGTQNNGLLKLNPFQQQVAFYNTQLTGQSGETNVAPNNQNWAYGQIKFEESPLNRNEEVFAAGSSWVGTYAQALEANRRSVKSKYWNNTVTDAVRIWTVTEPASVGSFGSYSSSAAYAAGILFKTVMVDEYGKQVIEFKDKAGQLILKKVQLTAAADAGSGSGHPGWLCTYYIYDNLGNLRCTVTPRGVELISSNWLLNNVDILAEQCYRYEYDARHRVIMKKVPGSGEEYMVYDNKGRLAMTQDANLRGGSPKKWVVTLYDKYDRAVQTGLWNDANTLSYHVTQANNSTAADYPFSETTTPGTGYERLTRIGYDLYSSFPTGTGMTTGFDNTFTSNNNYFYTTYNASPDYAQQFIVSSQIRGMVTWTETKILNSNPVKYLYTVNFYDDKGRLIQVKKKNITDGIDVVTTQYNWAGQTIRVLTKQEKAGTPSQTSYVLTLLTYDDLGRVTQVDKKIRNTLINADALPAVWSTIAKNEYDALGQLKTKKVGGKKDPLTGNYTGASLETMAFDYNVRGWLLGINRAYTATQGQSGTSLFGFELGYDKLTNLAAQNFTNTAQLNGNITGMIWKSDGDDIRRKYDFKYDEVYRMLKATFIQENPDDLLWNSAQLNYTVQMGDGNTAASAYDVNGNIKAMTQYGYKLGGNPQTPMDQLTYNYMYTNISNRLLNVIDANNLPDTKLGDFRTSLLHTQTKTSTTIDYTYDLNGNMVKDFNKDLVTYNNANGIAYNYLDLPETVVFKKDNTVNKGTITYTYDASGMKLKKQVQELGVTVVHNGTSYLSDITSTTLYVSGFVYETKVYSNATLNTALGYIEQLQFAQHEEGRVRLKILNSVLSLHYDYFIRDHVGNIRMALTEEANPASIYEATMELAARAYEVQLFTQIPQTESDTPYGFDNPVLPANAKVSKLFNISGSDKRVGVGIVLKVMAGDKFKAQCFGWYQPGATNVNPLPGAPGILANILSAFTGGVPVGGKYSGSEMSGSGLLNVPVGDFLTYQGGQTNTARPRAYLNWMILDDEQLKLVPGNYGVVQVPDITGTMQRQVMQAASGALIDVKRNGYLYVYVSNESQGSVYFDNIRVEHTRGALTEETHYYPVGMQMMGICSQALNSTLIGNDYKYQGQEYESGLGLNMLEFEARMYDPQIGRWHVPDPANQFASPYTGMGNNWAISVDPDGRIVFLAAIGIAALIGGTTNLAINAIQGNINNFKDGLLSFGIGAAQGALAVITGGSSYASMGAWQFAGQFALKQGIGVLASQLPSASISIGNFNFSLSASFMMGSDGFGFGASLGASYSSEDISVGVSYGLMGFGKTPATGGKSFERRIGYGGTINSRAGAFSLYRTHFKASNGTSQTVGGLGFSNGDFSFRFENDWPRVLGGDGGDRFRTTAVELGIGDFRAGVKLFTGEPQLKENGMRVSENGYYKETPATSRYRMGAAYVGYRQLSIGANSERIRNLIQNRIIHKILGFKYFKMIDDLKGFRPYYQYSSANNYTLW